MTKSKSKAKKAKVKDDPIVITIPDRMFRGEVVWAPPSPWWTTVALREDDGWYELYQAKNEREAKQQLAWVLDHCDEGRLDQYDDFAAMPPSVQHTIPSSAKSSNRAWLESILPVTEAKRRSLIAMSSGERGRTRRKKGSAT